MTHTLLDVIIILSITVGSVAILRRIGLGTVLGFLVAGIVVGPMGLGLLHHSKAIEHLGEFGLIFLLFIIGLDFQLSRLRQMKRALWGLGSAEFFLVGGIFFSIGLTIGLTVEQALILGFSLALSSTAMDLQLLSEKEELNTHFGRAALGTLLFQDLMAIPMLALLPLVADQTYSLSLDIPKALLKTGVLLGIVVVASRYIIPFVLRNIAKSRSPEAFTVSSIVLVLLMCTGIDFVGLPMSLGAFAAGMMLAESHYRHQIQTDIMPFKALLLGLFFVVLGTTLDLNFLVNYPAYILGAVLLLIGLKLFLIFLIVKAIMKLKTKESFKTALVLAQGGEFALVIFQLALFKFKIIPSEIGQGVMIAILISMALTPILYKIAEFFEDRGKLFPEKMIAGGSFKMMTTQDHVIIAGFGRVGQTIAFMLEKVKVPYTAIDMDPDRVVEGRNLGYPVFYGDATRYDMLRTVGAEKASVAVLALDNVSIIKKTLNAFKEHFSDVKVFARARNHFESEALKKQGAAGTIPETIESSLQLGRVVLSETGASDDQVIALMSQLRNKDYNELYHIIQRASQNPKKVSKTSKDRNKKIHKALAKMFQKGTTPVEELTKKSENKKPTKKKTVKKVTKKKTTKKKGSKSA